MAYDPTLSDSISRVRLIVGDVAATALLPDSTYTALIATHGEAGAGRMAAQALAVQYAQQPGSVTLPNGLSVSWASRVSTWLAIATGSAGGAVGGFSGSPVRGDAYAAAGSEYTE